MVLAEVENCEVYLDDLVAVSDTWCEHIKTLEIIFENLKEATLTLNIVKCEFGGATVTYFSEQVGQGQVRPTAAKVHAILDDPVPQTRH